VPQEIDAFLAEATSGDYDHLLQTNHGWVAQPGTRNQEPWPVCS